jgi:hypothetical protein
VPKELRVTIRRSNIRRSGGPWSPSRPGGSVRGGSFQGLDQSRGHHPGTRCSGRSPRAGDCGTRAHRSQRRQDREGSCRPRWARSGGLCGSFTTIWLPDQRGGPQRLDVQDGRLVAAQEHGHAAGLCSRRRDLQGSRRRGPVVRAIWRRKISVRNDQYYIGLLGLELLTGEPPVTVSRSRCISRASSHTAWPMVSAA